MSSTDSPPGLNPRRYTSGRDRYVRFAEDHLGVRLAETQKTVMQEATEHRYLIVQSGNGVGKSWGVGMLNLGFLYSNPDSENQTTSGSYSQLEDVIWRPMKNVWKQTTLPGRALDSNPPRLEIDDTWYWKAPSPKYPDELEGRHAGEMLMIIEEADKPSITEEHFKSAESNITDSNDRMVIVCNPPRGEENIVYEKLRNPKWHVVQFSSFDSHNILVDTGEIDDDPIPGLVDLPKIAEDWEDYNSEPWPKAAENWDGPYPGAAPLIDLVEKNELEREDVLEVLRPGVDEARRQSAPRLDEDGEITFLDDPDLRPNPDFRKDLNQEWYRRRAGIIPPDGAESYRPFYIDGVETCVEENDAPPRDEWGDLLGVGIDLARKGGDKTAVIVLYERVAVVKSWRGVNHPQNYSNIRDIVDDLPFIPQIAGDAVGEGSGVVDDLVEAYGGDQVTRFKAGEAPAEEQLGGGDGYDEYYDKWTEAVMSLGGRLADIAIVGDNEDVADLREELFSAGRTLELEDRRRRSGDLLKSSPKEDVKERLGRSPDHLEALALASWAADGCAPTEEEQESFLISY